ncbi:glucose-6-phosphate isomerase [Pararhizobium sp. IMCC21322]|uniref:glucose-6-phosphate isomerase n=1 Tax=Pararhizobium sp. IMCC21322 TaxID=3067903 RepID=UPI002740F2BD|nr:glucose-6-phosphate isomerase [Pararhizobium sp. IMCC21322]
MYIEPTTHTVDSMTGSLSNSTGRYQKKISDLKGIYADNVTFSRMCADDPDRIVYEVCEVRPQAESGDLIFGTTHMEPGIVGNEFFVTRGHIHARANRPETYYGESGNGLMLLESPHGDIRIMEVKPKTLIYVPPMWIHRSVNVCNTPLVMSFCYPVDSGQDYEIIAQSGGMAVRIVADGSGWKAIDNTDYKPRTEEQIETIHATRD